MIFDHRTNNACESYHHILNSKFNKKPSIWKLLSVLKDEENKLKLDIINLRNGNIKKKRGIPSFEYITKKYYDKYQEKIASINNSNSNNKIKEIINVWYEAALELPLYEYSV